MLNAIRARVSTLPTAIVVLALVLLIAPFFRPQIIEHIGHPELFDFYIAWKMCSSVASLLLFLLMGRRDTFALIATLLTGTTLASTAIFHGRLIVWFDQFFSFWAAVLLVLTIARFRKKDFLYALYIVSTSLLLCHCLSIVLFPNGIWGYQYYFFGNRNGIFILMLSSLGSSFVLDSLSCKTFSVRSSIPAFASCLSLYLSPSVTSILALCVLVGSWVLTLWKAPRRFLNGFSYLAFYFLGVVLVVFFRVQESLDWLVRDVFQKATTLSGRAPIWDAITSDCDPIFFPLGHGCVDYGYVSTNGLVFNAHNQLLHVWYMGGVIGIALFIALLVLAARNLYRYRLDRTASVIAAVLGAFFVVGITEADPYSAFYFVLAFAYCYEPAKNEVRGLHAVSS